MPEEQCNRHYQTNAGGTHRSTPVLSLHEIQVAQEAKQYSCDCQWVIICNDNTDNNDNMTVCRHFGASSCILTK